MSEISFIVDRLSQDPFNESLSLVTFDELSAFDLLSLLNRVLSHLNPEHKVELRDEPPEATGARIFSFVTMLVSLLPAPELRRYRAAPRCCSAGVVIASLLRTRA